MSIHNANSVIFGASIDADAEQSNQGEPGSGRK
jgi:hypothetical protein